MQNSLILHTWPVEKLVEYANNPRRNEAVVDKMCAAIREFGFRIPIVATSNGTVVDGHLRLKAAHKLNLDTVPVVLADDLTPTQIKAFRLLANQSANWAAWDEELLRLEFQGLQDADFNLELTGFDWEEINRFLDAHQESLPDHSLEDEVPAIEEVAVTKPGDIWLMGAHRLICGDSTQLETIDKLMQGAFADITVTDPPYNVNYGASLQATTRTKHNTNNHKILNDNLGENFAAFLYDVCTHILMITKGAVYICMAASELHTLQKAFLEAGGHWSTFIIWAKNHFALGRADYQRQYESILYGWKKGNDRYWCGARDQSDLWLIDKPSANKLHPTMKPLALIERMIQNSSQPQEVVFDPFGGSGTTLMVCEKLSRKCRMSELDPKYVDVIVKRWQEYTGKQAILESTGQSFGELMQLRG